jgi:hypothetical protein
MHDKDFLRYCAAHPEISRHTYDRRYFVRSILALADGLEGDTAECGAFQGAASWLICDHFAGTEKMHYIFDSFEGLSAPAQVDGQYWRAGDMLAREGTVHQVLAGYRYELLKGWIPERFPEIADCSFCFVHIDVDLFQPTLDSIAFFYPRMVPGGVILCDDYGFSSCPGARQALDDYMATRPEAIIHVPTGQAFIIRRLRPPEEFRQSRTLDAFSLVPD